MGTVLSLITFLFLTQSVFAETSYPLLKIYNAVEKETSKMDIVENDDGEATELRQEILKKGGIIKVFDLKKITNGIVLQEQKGFNIVTLKGKNIDFERGGELKMEFLVNAVTSKKKDEDFKIQKDPEGWRMYHRGQAIELMKFIGNKVPFVGLVGVKQIDIKYEGDKQIHTERFANAEEEETVTREFLEMNEDLEIVEEKEKTELTLEKTVEPKTTGT